MKASLGVPRWLLEFAVLGAIWGSSFLFMRLAVLDFGALPTAGLRVLVASAVLLPLLHWRGLTPVLRQHWKAVFLVGLLNSAIPFVCFAFALQSISTGLSGILNGTTPLFGALVAWLWLGDRPSRLRTLGLAVGFVGVTMLTWDKASFKPDATGLASGWAVLACLVATGCYGVAASYTKRYLSGLPTLVTATGSQVGSALALLVPTYWFWPTQAPGATAWLAVLAVGVLCTGVAYLIYFQLLGSIGPARTLAVTFVIPVFAVIYGVVLLAEQVNLWMLLCGAVILLGTALSAGLVRFGRHAQ